MTPNPNVNVDTEYSTLAVRFYPDEGYALWQDDEEGNLDENGNPMQYYHQKIIRKVAAENAAPHIWAKLIDETEGVYDSGDKMNVY